MADINQKGITIDLPFDHEITDVVIGQGFNSSFTHKPCTTIDLSYSVDFALEVGTPIITVANGVVKMVTKSSDCYRGHNPILGRQAWATRIEIYHPQFRGYPGRIYSMFQHLDPESIRVTIGQQITKGQILAYTGLTGWVGPIPHLHLSMVEARKYPNKTVPFDFSNYSASLEDKDVEQNLSSMNSAIASKIREIRKQACLP